MFITEPQDFISKELLALPRVTAKKIVSFLTGFGPYLRHLTKINPKKYKCTECRVCFEGGSTESPEHFMFECMAIK